MARRNSHYSNRVARRRKVTPPPSYFSLFPTSTNHRDEIYLSDLYETPRSLPGTNNSPTNLINDNQDLHYHSRATTSSIDGHCQNFGEGQTEYQA